MYTKYLFRTVNVTELTQEAGLLYHRIKRDYHPSVLIGIRSGGYRFASLMPLESQTVLLPFTCRRVGSEKKHTYANLLATICAILPYKLLNAIRLIEHLILQHTTLAKTSSFFPDQSELAAIQEVLAKQGDQARILVVDDALDSGLTMQRVVESLRTITTSSMIIKTAVLTVTTVKHKMRPDFALYEHVLFRFPWAMDFKKTQGSWQDLAPVKLDDTIFIVDLDETLLCVNSFRYWLAYLFIGTFPKVNILLRIKLFAQLTKAFFLRKTKAISHYEFKLQLQRLWLESTIVDEQHGATFNLSLALSKKIRPQFKSFLSYVAQGKIHAILATAAAGDYAEPFGKQLGFNAVLATPSALDTTQESLENRGEEKLHQVQHYLVRYKLESKRIIVFTDHLEDMPLISHCHMLGWFGDALAIPAIHAQAPAANVIHCLGMTNEAFVKTFLCPSNV